jgi:hypothetical protein
MCYAEQIWKTGKIRRCSCQNLKSNLISKRRILDREASKTSFTAFDTLSYESMTSMGINVLRSEAMPILPIVFQKDC